MLHHGGGIASAVRRASYHAVRSDAFAAFSQSIESIKNGVLPEIALPPPAMLRSWLYWCAGHRPRWRLFESCSRYGNFYHRYRYLFHPYLLPQRTRNESHQLQQQDAVDEEEVADYYGRRPLCFGSDGNPVDQCLRATALRDGRSFVVDSVGRS